MRMTDKKLVLMALDAALQWEGELRDGSPQDQAEKCQEIMNGYRRVIKRLTNGSLTITEMAYERSMANAKSVGIKDIQDMADRGEIEVLKIPTHSEEQSDG